METEGLQNPGDAVPYSCRKTVDDVPVYVPNLQPACCSCRSAHAVHTWLSPPVATGTAGHTQLMQAERVSGGPDSHGSRL